MSGETKQGRSMSAPQNAEKARKVYSRGSLPPNPKSTVADLIAWCAERGFDPAAVRLHGGFTLNWSSPETDEEMAARIERERASQERHREWVRKRYAELFGDTHTPPD